MKSKNEIKKLKIGDELIKVNYVFGIIIRYNYEKIKESHFDKYVFESGNVEYKNRLASYCIKTEENIYKIEEKIKNQKLVEVKYIIQNIFKK